MTSRSGSGGKAKRRARKARQRVAAPAAAPSPCQACMRGTGAGTVADPPRPPRLVCCGNELAVQVPGRKKTLRLPRTAGAPTPVLHLIADKSSGRREVRFSLAGGPCADGLADRPCVEIFDETALAATDRGAFSYRASGPQLRDLSWRTVLFPFDLVHRHRAEALLCDGGGRCAVELLVHPHVRYAIEISLPGIEFGVKRSTDRHGRLPPAPTSETALTWGGSFEVEVGSMKYRLGDDFKRSLDEICGVARMGLSFFELVDRVLDAGGRKAIKAELSGMKLVAKAHFEQRESDDLEVIDRAVELSARFDPMFRAAVTLDVIETLITALGKHPIGAVIEWAYHASLSDPSDPPVEICVQLAGEIGGGATWTHTFGAAWTSEKDFTGSIGLKVWGAAKGKVRCLAVSAGASAKVSAQSRIWLKVLTESTAPGELAIQMGHDGITFTCAAAVTWSGSVSSEDIEEEMPAGAEREFEWIAPSPKPPDDNKYRFQFWGGIDRGTTEVPHPTPSPSSDEPPPPTPPAPSPPAPVPTPTPTPG